MHVVWLDISRGGSVSTVSDYGLDDQDIEVRSPAETKDFSCSLCVQTGSGAHPASCPMGTGGPFPGVKRGRVVTLTTHPHLVPRSGVSRIYTCVACSGTTLLFFLLCFCVVRCMHVCIVVPKVCECFQVPNSLH
jgi:hypothetical protein